MGNAKVKGDYATRKAVALARPLRDEPLRDDTQRVPMALYSPVTITKKDGTKEDVIERHKDGEKIVSADGRTTYRMDRRGLRRVS